jgi:hypothetical protein
VDHGAVVRIAYRDEAAGLDDTLEFLECSDRGAEVLEDLVAIGDIEAVVLVGEGVDVADLELEVRYVGGGGEFSCLLDDLGDEVDADDVALWEVTCESDGDAAGSAAEVEELHRWCEVGEEEGGGFLGGTAAMLIDDGGVVAVGVLVRRFVSGHRLILGRSPRPPHRGLRRGLSVAD